MRCLAVVCLSLFTACQSPNESPVTHPIETTARKVDSAAPRKMVLAPKDTTTLGGVWYLQAVLPSDTVTGRTPVLDLDLAKSHFSGNNGCNSMRGSLWFSSVDSSLSFSEKVVQTRMSCPGYNETGFMKSLRSAGRFRLHQGTLTLLSDDNTELSHWARKPSPDVQALKS